MATWMSNADKAKKRREEGKRHLAEVERKAALCDEAIAELRACDKHIWEHHKIGYGGPGTCEYCLNINVFGRIDAIVKKYESSVIKTPSRICTCVTDNGVKYSDHCALHGNGGA